MVADPSHDRAPHTCRTHLYLCATIATTTGTARGPVTPCTSRQPTTDVDRCAARRHRAAKACSPSRARERRRDPANRPNTEVRSVLPDRFAFTGVDRPLAPSSPGRGCTRCSGVRTSGTCKRVHCSDRDLSQRAQTCCGLHGTVRDGVGRICPAPAGADRRGPRLVASSGAGPASSGTRRLLCVPR